MEFENGIDFDAVPNEQMIKIFLRALAVEMEKYILSKFTMTELVMLCFQQGQNGNAKIKELLWLEQLFNDYTARSNGVLTAKTNAELYSVSLTFSEHDVYYTQNCRKNIFEILTKG